MADLAFSPLHSVSQVKNLGLESSLWSCVPCGLSLFLGVFEHLKAWPYVHVTPRSSSRSPQLPGNSDWSDVHMIKRLSCVPLWVLLGRLKDGASSEIGDCKTRDLNVNSSQRLVCLDAWTPDGGAVHKLWSHQEAELLWGK